MMSVARTQSTMSTIHGIWLAQRNFFSNFVMGMPYKPSSLTEKNRTVYFRYVLYPYIVTIMITDVNSQLIGYSILYVKQRGNIVICVGSFVDTKFTLVIRQSVLFTVMIWIVNRKERTVRDIHTDVERTHRMVNRWTAQPISILYYNNNRIEILSTEWR